MGWIRLVIALIRLIILLFTRRWGLIVVGSGCLIVGLIVGLQSHEITYQRTESVHIAHFLSTDTGKVGYLQLDNGPTVFTVEQDAFNPAIGGIQTFQDGDNISVVYRTDTTTYIDETSTIGTRLVGNAYPVVEIHDYANNTEYTTDEYNQNPVDYYQNNWGIGSILLATGVLMAGLALFLPMILAKSGKRIDININASAFMARRGYKNSPQSALPVLPTPVQHPVMGSYVASQMVESQSQNPYANPYTSPTQYEEYQATQPQEYPPYQPYPPLDPYQQNPYSQHGQTNNPYPPYQQPQE